MAGCNGSVVVACCVCLAGLLRSTGEFGLGWQCRSSRQLLVRRRPCGEAVEQSGQALVTMRVATTHHRLRTRTAATPSRHAIL